MRSVVVYESMFGNTHAIANEIARGLEYYGPVTIGTPEQVPVDSIADIDLLVLGGPTHVHGLASPKSTSSAVETAEADPEIDLDDELGGLGLRAWLRSLPRSERTASAAFDTRVDKPALFTGSAAKGIAKRLRRHGFDVVVDPQSFFVADMDGPLLAGETDRAREWAGQVAGRCAHRATG